MWYRRFAKRGKIDTFQLLIKRKSPGGQLPVLHHRAPMWALITVPDDRLNKLAGLVEPDRIVPATVEIVDIAGLVKGASKGEGWATSSWPTFVKRMPFCTCCAASTMRT